MEILPSCSCVNTTIWLHHSDSNEAPGKKTRWERNYARMLCAVLNIFWKQHSRKQQLYGHLLSISQTTQLRQARHDGDCWRCKDVLINDVLLWTHTHGHTSVGQSSKTFIYQLCTESGFHLVNLPRATTNGDRRSERVKRLHAIIWP